MLFLAVLAILATLDCVAGLPLRRQHAHHAYLSRQLIATNTSSIGENDTSGNATTGCGLTPSWKFDDTNHVNMTMGDRSFLVHIPANYDVNTPHPMVLSFHGFKDNDLKQEEITGLSQKGLTLNNKVSVSLYST